MHRPLIVLTVAASMASLIAGPALAVSGFGRDINRRAACKEAIADAVQKVQAEARPRKVGFTACRCRQNPGDHQFYCVVDEKR